MAHFEVPVRRLILAGGFAAAIAISPMVAVFGGPGAAVGVPNVTCPAGESEDPYTFSCVPELVPTGIGSTSPASSTGPQSEGALTACSGTHESECLERQLYPGASVPNVNTSVQQSP
ncbi:MAG: intersectin-EH binding protein Ibp1 [Candidatus Sericytochromatia bacterium]